MLLESSLEARRMHQRQRALEGVEKQKVVTRRIESRQAKAQMQKEMELEKNEIRMAEKQQVGKPPKYSLCSNYRLPSISMAQITSR